MSRFPHNILSSSEGDPARIGHPRGSDNESPSRARSPGPSSSAMAPLPHRPHPAYAPRYGEEDPMYRTSAASSSRHYDVGPGHRHAPQPQMPPQPSSHHDRTLPPLSSFAGRPASASASAGSATLLPGWEQNRPRAASASSTTANRPVRPSAGIDRLAMHSMSERHGHSSPPMNLPPPTSTWSSQQRSAMSSRYDRTRSYSRPEPYVIPSGAAVPAGYGPPSTGPSPMPRTHPSVAVTPPETSEVRAYTGLPGSSDRPARGGGSSSMAGSSASQRPSLSGFSKVKDGRRYKLVVVQSPSRARMCGFGDKDRRPLNPTLIVKLVISEVGSNQVIAPTDVDTSAFFLAADLVHPDDLKATPRNLLVHQHAATVSTEMLQQSGPPGAAHDPTAGPSNLSTFDVERVRSRSLSDPWLAAQVTPSWGSHQMQHSAGGGFTSLTGSNMQAVDPTAPYTTVTTETYTRNFVGASVASANILKDEHDNLGIFFVLQDLSVRTEGVYRIKLMFANLSGSEGQIKPGVSEALAEAYTEPFTVYTPRRFPGVIEPTALSKKFAAQGVKIPVRVDRKKRRRDSGDGDGGDGDGDDDGDDD